MSQLVIGAKEVAALLGCCPETARRMLRSRKLRAMKLNGKTWRTTPDLVHAFIAASISQHNRQELKEQQKQTKFLPCFKSLPSSAGVESAEIGFATQLQTFQENKSRFDSQRAAFLSLRGQ